MKRSFCAYFATFIFMTVGCGVSTADSHDVVAEKAVGGKSHLNISRPENLINVSWGDQVMLAHGDNQLDSPEKIQRALKYWLKDFDAKTVLWRCSADVVKRYYVSRRTSDFYVSFAKKIDSIYSQFNPIEVVRKATEKNNQQFLCYMTIFDHGAPPTDLYAGNTPFPFQDKFTIDSPQYQTVDRKGNYHNGVLEMAYPESRKLMVDRIKTFVDEFKADGVYVCTRTHSLPAKHADQFGFSVPVVKEFQKRYGIDILKDPRFDYTNPKFDSKGSMVAAWRKLRGEYLVQFYRELRAALPGKTIYTGIPRGRYMGAPYGNLYLDWETLVSEKLVDGIIVGVYAGKTLHPPLYVPHAGIGYLSDEDDRINIPSLEMCCNQIYGPICDKNGVKLFYYGGNYERQKRILQEIPFLQGFMIYTPSDGLGQGVIQHDDRLCFPNGRMTIDARVFVNDYTMDGAGDQSRVISKYDHSEGDKSRGYEWIIDGAGKLRFRVNLDIPGKTNVDGDVALISKNSIPLKKWCHIATVFDLPVRQMRIYINGKLDSSCIIPPYNIRMNRQQNLYLGRYGGMDTRQFDGKLDELRFTSAALTFDAIPAKPYTGDEPNLVALYHMDCVDVGGYIAGQGEMGTPIRVLSSSPNVLTPSEDGFGEALNMRP